MNSKLYDRTEVKLIASCFFYNKEDKTVNLYLFNEL